MQFWSWTPKLHKKMTMTYNPSFEKALKKASDWITSPISSRTIIYAGSLEDSNGDIRLLNYLHV